MKTVAVIVGLMGLAVLPSSFGLGLLMLAVAVGLWVADSSQKAQKPSSPHPAQRPSRYSTMSTAPATPRSAVSPLALPAADMQWRGPGGHVMVHGHLIADALVYYCLSLELPRSYSDPRPRSVIVFRDGQVIHWEPYAIVDPRIKFTWTDPHPLPGRHSYTVYVPSKFLSSPVQFSM